MQISQGVLSDVTFLSSPHQDERPDQDDISLLVIHNISLPPGEFGGNAIDDLFMGRLNPEEDPFFEQIHHMRVSAHCLIRREGEVRQYVPFSKRAWHAGVSSFQGRTACNDFSIGIELEGTDSHIYTDKQYQSLTELTQSLIPHYPKITLDRIVGHNDIAPLRKTDPGAAFDWTRYRQSISTIWN
jgi:AmpD protein